MKEREFINNIYKLLSSHTEGRNKITIYSLKKCIKKCIGNINSRHNLNLRDFLYHDGEVIIQNRTLITGMDVLGRAHTRLYSPKPDLAFAPFNLSPRSADAMSRLCECIERNCLEIKEFIVKLRNSCRKNAEKYKEELKEYKELIIWLINHSRGSLDPIEVIGKVNPITRNPRSFIAVEICFSGSMKHTLGSLVNASLLGYYGVLVVNDKMLKKALRLKYYLLSIATLKEIKSTIGRNVLIVTSDQFLEAVKPY